MTPNDLFLELDSLKFTGDPYDYFGKISTIISLLITMGKLDGKTLHDKALINRILLTEKFGYPEYVTPGPEYIKPISHWAQ